MAAAAAPEAAGTPPPFPAHAARVDCPYFRAGQDSFGILLKGKSIEKLPRCRDAFDDCFIVNNFDEELAAVGDIVERKNCVHFVNRLMTAPLTPEHYRRLGISDVQLIKKFTLTDWMVWRVILRYKRLGLRVHWLPEPLLAFNRFFDPQYANKFPNTGVLAIFYALEVLRPKTLWVVGLDFYQADYLFRRPHQNPLDVQREKMKRTNLAGVVAEVFAGHPGTEIKLLTYYEDFPEIPNVTIA